MNQKNTSFGLANMNGISDDSGRSCAFAAFISCREGDCSGCPLRQFISSSAQPDRTCSLTNMNCRHD